MDFEFSAVMRVAVSRRWGLEMRRLMRVTGRHLAMISLALTTSCNANNRGIAGSDFGASARIEPTAMIVPTKLDVNTFVAAANREAQIVGAKQTCFASQLADHAAEAAIVKSMIVVAVVDADGVVKMFLITLFPQPICQNEKHPLAQA
jgi:ADP-ribosylglycohydrolase